MIINVIVEGNRAANVSVLIWLRMLMEVIRLLGANVCS